MTSPFERQRINLPAKRKGHASVHLTRLKAKPLDAGEGPPAVRSGVMIDQMRQALKRAIRQLRGEQTQEIFAQRVGVSQAALARMESPNNDVFPSTQMIIRMALVSGRDLEMSLVKRVEAEAGPDIITAETAGFPSSQSRFPGLEENQAEKYTSN